MTRVFAAAALFPARPAVGEAHRWRQSVVRRAGRAYLDHPCFRPRQRNHGPCLWRYGWLGAWPADPFYGRGQRAGRGEMAVQHRQDWRVAAVWNESTETRRRKRIRRIALELTAQTEGRQASQGNEGTDTNLSSNECMQSWASRPVVGRMDPAPLCVAASSTPTHRDLAELSSQSS